MSKKTTAGSEVDSWCTKCKLDLGHRIIAMEGDAIKRVECLTCKGHHNYRRPKSAEPLVRTRTRRAPTVAQKRAAEKAALEAQQLRWEQAVAGTATKDFTSYRITEAFEPEQLVRHKKFGDGLVTDVLQDGKIRVLFGEGEKLLVHCR
jgi:Zn ribbon nucleic-acid-binding protein